MTRKCLSGYFLILQNFVSSELYHITVLLRIHRSPSCVFVPVSCMQFRKHAVLQSIVFLISVRAAGTRRYSNNNYYLSRHTWMFRLHSDVLPGIYSRNDSIVDCHSSRRSFCNYILQRNGIDMEWCTKHSQIMIYEHVRTHVHVRQM